MHLNWMHRNDLRICKNSRFEEMDTAYAIDKMEFNLMCGKRGVDAITSRQMGFTTTRGILINLYNLPRITNLLTIISKFSL